MQAIKTFVKSTLVGGLLFLVPLMLLLMLLGKAMGLASKLAHALANGLHLVDSISVTLLTVLAIAIIVFVCFVAGLIALTRPGAKLAKWFEHSMLGAMPQY